MKECLQRAKVLLGEDFRRRHHDALSTVFRGRDERCRRDDRLAATDVALYEPAHRQGLSRVVQHFKEHALLRAGELERQ